MSKQDEESEMKALAMVKALVEQLAAEVGPIWRWGDGYGGEVKNMLREAIEERGLSWECAHEPPKYKRGYLSPAIRAHVMKRCDMLCSYCSDPLSPRQATIDHIIPISKGGTDELSNLTLSCRRCNSIKGNRL